MADLNLLRQLCVLKGVSGSEEPVRDFILKEIEPCASSVQVDPLGNILAFKRGKKRAATRLMLSAHMDEVGLIVTHITKDGLLKFTEVGGIDRRVLCGTPVTVGENTPGVVGVKPVHLVSGADREKAVPVDELYIDIGAQTREEAEQQVQPGDMACFESVFHTFGGTVQSRGLDDRAGCAILIELLKSDLEHDMHFAFVVQEEVGLRGATTAAFQLEPQAAIVVEATTAADIAGVEEEKRVCRVGKGPVVSFMDRRTIYDREYFLKALSLAHENGIPVQSKQAVAGGNDAGAIHASRGGVRTIAVSLACRYLHSPVSLISQEDFQHTEQLIRLLAQDIAGSEPFAG